MAGLQLIVGFLHAAPPHQACGMLILQRQQGAIRARAAPHSQAPLPARQRRRCTARSTPVCSAPRAPCWPPSPAVRTRLPRQQPQLGTLLILRCPLPG